MYMRSIIIRAILLSWEGEEERHLDVSFSLFHHLSRSEEEALSSVYSEFKREEWELIHEELLQ